MSRRSVLQVGLYVGASAALGSIFVASEAFGADALKPFLGAYKFVGGKKEIAARDKAIEEAVAGIGALFRGVARDMLRAANEIPEKIAIETKKQSLTVKADDAPFTAPTDGSAVRVKVVTGDVMRMHYDIASGQLDQIFEGDDRSRTNSFTKAKDKLLLEVTVTADALPKDLVYKLTYEPA
ncbi:MAG: hypothetical protein U0271_18770 [Polyangiaceae bacterium]